MPSDLTLTDDERAALVRLEVWWHSTRNLNGTVMGSNSIPIIAVLISVAGTLGVTWLGFQLSKGKEERQWRRDRCLSAYAEVLTLASQLREQCEDPTGRTASDPQKAKLLWSKNMELALASKKSAMLAPAAVQERIIELVKWEPANGGRLHRPEKLRGYDANGCVGQVVRPPTAPCEPGNEGGSP